MTAKAKEYRPEKVEAVKEIKEKFQKAKIAIFTDYQGKSGLPVKELQKLRRKLLENKGEFKVVKNTLTQKALAELKLDNISKYFERTSAIAFGYEDPASVAKALYDFSKESAKEKGDEELPAIKGAWFEEKILELKQVQFLASLPPRNVLLAQVLGTLQAPITGLVTVLSGTVRSVVTVLDAIRRQKEENQAAPAAQGE